MRHCPFLGAFRQTTNGRNGLDLCLTLLEGNATVDLPICGARSDRRPTGFACLPPSNTKAA